MKLNDSLCEIWSFGVFLVIDNSYWKFIISTWVRRNLYPRNEFFRDQAKWKSGRAVIFWVKLENSVPQPEQILSTETRPILIYFGVGLGCALMAVWWMPPEVRLFAIQQPRAEIYSAWVVLTWLAPGLWVFLHSYSAHELNLPGLESKLGMIENFSFLTKGKHFDSLRKINL